MASKEFKYTPDEFEFMYKGVLYDHYTTLDIVKECEKFEFRSDDIVIMSYLRTGTTLTQELTWEILHHENVEKDVLYESMFVRFGFLEFDPNFKNHNQSDPLEMLKQQPLTKRRLIKTHLPYSILGEQLEKANPKVVIVMRNPKDAAIALYHFQQGVRGESWTTSFQDFLTYFLNGKTNTGDFFSNYLDWWSLRDRPNVLILRYEDILANKHQQVRTLAGFFGVDVPAEKVDVIVHNSSFSTMWKNMNVNIVLDENKKHKFLRKGKSGDWRNVLTVAQNEEFDRVIEERLRGTCLSFQYS